MDFSGEDLRRYYEERSDAGLLSIDREELTDLARLTYDREMDRRGLKPQVKPESRAVAREQEPIDDLVQVATFVFPHEAKFARAELEAENIYCFLDNERTLDVDWFLSNLLGGYRLLVPASQVERARAILDSHVSEEELDAQAEAAGGLPGADARPPGDPL